MEGYNMILDNTICSGFRTLVDKLDEDIAGLSAEQKKELLQLLRNSWSVVERRAKERRAV